MVRFATKGKVYSSSFTIDTSRNICAFVKDLPIVEINLWHFDIVF